MHICESAFRRRNSILHEANEADKANEATEADETGEINRRNN